MDTPTLGAIAALFALLGISLNLVQAVLRQRWDSRAAAARADRDAADRQHAADETARKNKELLDQMAEQAAEINRAMSGLQSLQLTAIGKAEQTFREANNANVKIAQVSGHLDALRTAGVGQMAEIQTTGGDTNTRVREIQAQAPTSLADQLAAAQRLVADLQARANQ